MLQSLIQMGTLHTIQVSSTLITVKPCSLGVLKKYLCQQQTNAASFNSSVYLMSHMYKAIIFIEHEDGLLQSLPLDRILLSFNSVFP